MSSPYPNSAAFKSIVNFLELNQISLEKFIHSVIVDPQLAHHLYISNCIQSLPYLLDNLTGNVQAQPILNTWTKQKYLRTLRSEVSKLTKPENGFHFNASLITAEQIKECSIRHIEQGINQHAPELRELVGELLQADPVLQEQRRTEREKREKVKEQKRERPRKLIIGSRPLNREEW
jgi:hypothetical protein